jgi:hypothetical protein
MQKKYQPLTTLHHRQGSRSTPLMHTNKTNNIHVIRLEGEDLENIDKFIHLSSIVSKNRPGHTNLNRKASAAFKRIKPT